MSKASLRKPALSTMSDEQLKRPLWEFPPAERLRVLHQRRRRFGVYDEIGDPQYS